MQETLSQPSSTSYSNTAADVLRRFTDVISAAAGIVLLSPLFLTTAALIKLTSTGPVFYRAQRVGKDGDLFYALKFRTMVVDADKRGPNITISDDQRVTPIGRFLRRVKWDELPQLINVLKGEMSLVGPRPEVSRYVAMYTPEQREVLRVRPGITSAASLRYFDEEKLLASSDWEDIYVQRIMPDKLAIDLAYLSSRTLFSDLKLILQTMLAILY